MQKPDTCINVPLAANKSQELLCVFAMMNGFAKLAFTYFFFLLRVIVLTKALIGTSIMSYPIIFSY